MTIATRSARSRLLRRGRRDDERTELSLEFGGVEAGPRCQPVAWAQLEEALARPVGQDAELVAEVRLGVEVVEASRGDQRHQVAGGLRVVVAADEEPRLATEGDAAELALGGVVVEAQTPVIVELCQRASLAMGIAERGPQQAALIADALVLGFEPGEEGVDVGPEVVSRSASTSVAG